MKPTDESLLDEIIDADAGDSFRGETLRQSLDVLRRRRQKKALARRTLLVMVPLALIAVTALISRQSFRRDAGPVVAVNVPETSTPETIPGTTVRIISDDELFALFPDRAVALIGEKNHQTLVFLDGDSAVRN